MEPARSDETAEPPGYAQAFLGQDGHWYKDPLPTTVHQIPRFWPWPSEAESGQLPVVGPTEALRGRAGGPGLAAPPGAVPGLLDSEGRSSWQLAQRVWAESGVGWEPVGPAAADFAPAAGFAGFADDGDDGDDGDEASADWNLSADEWAEPVEEPDEPAEDWLEPVERRVGPVDGWAGHDADREGQVPTPPGAFRAMPLGAPVAAEQQAPWSAETPPLVRTPAPPLGEPDALFRAWQGSVRQAAAADPRGRWSAPPPGRTARRRRRAWRSVTIGVPAAVIVTVGAGALMMLTGKANEMLAVRGDTGTHPPGASASASGADQGADQGANQGGAGVTGVILAGYPGQHGAVAADSLWSAAGVSLAVGDADGHPAVWRQSGGSWTLVSAAVLSAVPGTGTLTAVAHGPAGWIAVGLTARGGTTYPLVFASTDGLSWQPVATLRVAAGSAVEFLGVAAGPDGYAVVGRQLTGGRIFASLWWSADMRMWVQGANGGLDGRLTASTANAAAATATGFVAVGSHGAFASIWTSPDGAHWNLRNISVPSGARSATLRQVVASGNTIVATGFATTGTGDIPLAVTSTDGGAHWRSVILPAPDGLGVVTALTAKGGTLIAAGQAGRASAGRFVSWTSPDGLRWSAATVVAGIRQLSAMSASGTALTGTGSATAQHGAGSSIVTFPAP